MFAISMRRLTPNPEKASRESLYIKSFSILCYHSYIHDYFWCLKVCVCVHVYSTLRRTRRLDPYKPWRQP